MLWKQQDWKNVFATGYVPFILFFLQLVTIVLYLWNVYLQS